MISVDAPAARPARTVSHWTPRYVCNRVRQMLYERGHADDPWLTPAAIQLLGPLLRPDDEGVEFGSGRSTVWFAQRVRSLTSVEHDAQWHSAVSARLKERGLGNVDYILAPEDQPMERGGESAYARTALAFRDDSIDFALVDGHYRDYSAELGPKTPVWVEVERELNRWRSLWTSSGVWDTAIFIKS